jgi:hypothetical protein
MPLKRIPAMSGIGHGDLHQGCGVKSWPPGLPSPTAAHFVAWAVSLS